ILADETDQEHEFVAKDARDSYRSRHKLKYSGVETVEDGGLAHDGSHATYKLLILSPGRPLVILRRMDYVNGDYELEFFVNGKSAATVSCAGTDRIHRWRNWPVLIPAEHVTDSTVTIKQVAVTAGRDVNVFH